MKLALSIACIIGIVVTLIQCYYYYLRENPGLSKFYGWGAILLVICVIFLNANIFSHQPVNKSERQIFCETNLPEHISIGSQLILKQENASSSYYLVDSSGNYLVYSRNNGYEWSRNRSVSFFTDSCYAKETYFKNFVTQNFSLSKQRVYRSDGSN